MVIKVAGYPEYRERLFDELRKGGQKLYDRVLEDPSLIDQKVDEWKDKEAAADATTAPGGVAAPLPGIDTTIPVPGTDPITDAPVFGEDPTTAPAPGTTTAPVPEKPKEPNALEKLQAFLDKKQAEKPKPPAPVAVANPDDEVDPEDLPEEPPKKTAAQLRAEKRIAEKIAKAGIDVKTLEAQLK